MELRASDAELLPLLCPAPMPSVLMLRSLHTMGQCWLWQPVLGCQFCSLGMGWCRAHGTGAGMDLGHCSSGQWGQCLPGSVRGMQYCPAHCSGVWLCHGGHGTGSPCSFCQVQVLPSLCTGCVPSATGTCSPHCSAVSPAQDADSLPPHFPLPAHSCLCCEGTRCHPHACACPMLLRTPVPCLGFQ